MPSKFEPKQLKAMHMLMGGRSCSYISSNLKLRHGTLARWLKTPKFIAEYESMMEQKRFELQHELRTLMNSSVSALKSALYNDGVAVKRLEILMNEVKNIEKLQVDTSTSACQTSADTFQYGSSPS